LALAAFAAIMLATPIIQSAAQTANEKDNGFNTVAPYAIVIDGGKWVCAVRKERRRSRAALQHG